MKFQRTVVRLPDAQRARLDDLRSRCTESTYTPISRADLIRFFVKRGLDAINDAVPILEQIPREQLVIVPSRVPRPQVQTSASLRDRIVQAMAAHPAKVFPPARMALLLGASSKDSIRNTLLALAKQGRVKKLGPGRYRALAMPKADGPA